MRLHSSDLQRWGRDERTNHGALQTQSHIFGNPPSVVPHYCPHSSRSLSRLPYSSRPLSRPHGFITPPYVRHAALKKVEWPCNLAQTHFGHSHVNFYRTPPYSSHPHAFVTPPALQKVARLRPKWVCTTCTLSAFKRHDCLYRDRGHARARATLGAPCLVTKLIVSKIWPPRRLLRFAQCNLELNPLKK